MAPVTYALAAALLATAATATPIVTIDSFITVPFAKRLNITNMRGVVLRDQQRAQFLKGGRNSGLGERATSVPATNGEVSYLATISVGSPATSYSLIIDTGSSNTWVGAGTAYKRTSTSTSTGHSVSVSYGSGSFSGTEFTDRVAYGSTLVVAKQSIGVASSSTGFDGVDGILGIGPVDLTEGTVASTSTVPTFTDNLFSSGLITANQVGVSFQPTTSSSAVNGELTFGGADSSKFTGSMTFGSTNTSPANEFWGVNQSVNYAGTTILSSTAGIVDTGTTLVLLATNAFTKYKSATKAVSDANTGLLRVTSAQFSAMSNLNFVIGGTTFALTPNGQIWPRALNTDIGGTSGSIYLIVADLGSNSGEGLDFINGQTFLERFYTLFDTTNRRVGFATTPFTTATTN